MLRKIILAIGAILALWPSGATAQKLDIGPCIADFRKLCPRIEPGDDRLHSCLKWAQQRKGSGCSMTVLAWPNSVAISYRSKTYSRNKAVHLVNQTLQSDHGQQSDGCPVR